MSLKDVGLLGADSGEKLLESQWREELRPLGLVIGDKPRHILECGTNKAQVSERPVTNENP